MAIQHSLSNPNNNSNSATNREPAVMYFNADLFGWSPRFGTAITQSDINKSEVLQAILQAIHELDGEMIPGKAYTFEGISGHFKSAQSAVKPAAEGLTITLTSQAG